MRIILWLFAFAACGSVTASDAPDAMVASDDASNSPAPASLCFGGGLVKLCLTTLPVEELDIVDAKQIDTDHDSRCASFSPANADWCVIPATRLLVTEGATLSAVGRRALVLAATGEVDIEGTLDIGSHSTATHVRGAGLGVGSCTNAAPVPTGGLGGGNGGSFRSRGGNGGSSSGAQSQGLIAGPLQPLDKLRGGCSGGVEYIGPDDSALVATAAVRCT